MLTLLAALTTARAQGRFGEVGFHPGATECALGLYDHDADPATACETCPAGTFSASRWAVGKSPLTDERREGDGFLVAGAGNLVLDLDNGNMQWENMSSSKAAHPTYATATECRWDPCVAGCGCAVFCSAMCEGEEIVGSLGHAVSTLEGFTGANGVRTCGVACVPVPTIVLLVLIVLIAKSLTPSKQLICIVAHTDMRTECSQFPKQPLDGRRAWVRPAQ
jgi:hypothetical protein